MAVSDCGAGGVTVICSGALLALQPFASVAVNVYDRVPAGETVQSKEAPTAPQDGADGDQLSVQFAVPVRST